MCSGCRYVASRATSCDGEGREKQALDGTLVVGVLIEWRGVQCSVSRSGALKHTRIGTLEHRNIGNRRAAILSPPTKGLFANHLKAILSPVFDWHLC